MGDEWWEWCGLGGGCFCCCCCVGIGGVGGGDEIGGGFEDEEGGEGCLGELVVCVERRGGCEMVIRDV